MFGLKDFSVSFLTGVPVLVSLSLIILLALAVFLYYRTNPPLPRLIRIIMGILRGIAIIALLLVLFEPVVKYEREISRNRRVAVLLDRSLSMNHQEAGKSRTARTDSLLSSSVFDGLKNSTDISVQYFASNLETSQDKLEPDRTAIGDALHELNTRQVAEPFDNILLLSDGRSNSGRSVTEVSTEHSAPISAIDMTESFGGGFDIGIERIENNAVLCVGQQTEIQVTIGWRNATGKHPQIQLFDGNRPATQVDFPITEPEGRGDIRLKFTPTQPGQQLLRINIPVLSGEETENNNSKTISVKVLKNRLQILFVTAEPDYEVGFLKRFLVKTDRYDVDLKVVGPRAGNLAGQFPSNQTELNRYDLVILHDPDPVLYEGKQQIIKSYLSEKGGAVWVMMGNQFANRGPVKWFNDLLPFYQANRRPIEYGDFHGEPSEKNLFHPVVRLAEGRTEIRDAWMNLPPFKSLVRCEAVDQNAEQLVYANFLTLPNSKLPIIGYKRLGPGKLLASAVLPFWTWGFLNIGFGGNDSLYASFIDGTVRWLTVRDDFDPIRIGPEKEIFTRGEPVRFQGYALDQGYRPIPGVTGVVKITNDSTSATIDGDLIDKGEGKFEAEFSQVPPGRYSYTASLMRDNLELKQAKGTIAVEAFSLEEFDQSGDQQTLMAVSRLTGGKYYSFRQFDDAVNSIDRAVISESQKGEIVLWNKFWLLILFIGMLGIEWIIRKLNQLL